MAKLTSTDVYGTLNVQGDTSVEGDSTLDGEVTIGTNTPFTTGGTAKVTIATNVPGSNVALSIGDSNANMIYFRHDGAGVLNMQSYNNTNSGFINLQPYGGNVGIGETTPLGKLHVKDGDAIIEQGNLIIASSSNAEGGEDGGGTGRPTLWFSEGEGTAVTNQSMGIEYDGDGLNGDANRISIVNGSSTELVSFQSGGNVGIGTTTPAQKLDVNGNVNVSGYLVATSNLVTNNNIYLNYDNSPAGADATIYFGDDASDTAHYLQFDNSAQKFNFSNDILVNGSPIGGGGAASLTQVYDNTTGTTSLVLDSGTVKSGSGIVNIEASLSPSTNDATIDEDVFIINTMDASGVKDAYNTSIIHVFDNTSFSSVPGANITITGNGTYVASGLAFWGVGAGAANGVDTSATQNGIRIGLRVVVTNWNPLGDSYNYQWQVYVQGFFGDSENYITSVYTL